MLIQSINQSSQYSRTPPVGGSGSLFWKMQSESNIVMFVGIVPSYRWATVPRCFRRCHFKFFWGHRGEAIFLLFPMVLHSVKPSKMAPSNPLFILTFPQFLSSSSFQIKTPEIHRKICSDCVRKFQLWKRSPEVTLINVSRPCEFGASSQVNLSHFPERRKHQFGGKMESCVRGKFPLIKSGVNSGHYSKNCDQKQNSPWSIMSKIHGIPVRG